jgi:AcrR family transcriptional regulator
MSQVTVTLSREEESAGQKGSSDRSFSPTEERILVAALGLIGRRGVRRLGMQEISEAAGVSRGTLYRYFPSKERVLAAAADYDERRFSDGADAVLAAVSEPEQRISAFLGYAFDFIRSHSARSLFESEPGFVLSYLLDHLPALRGELVLRLGDALDEVPAVKRGDLDREQLADVIVRLFASSWIIPESDEHALVQSIDRILQLADA